MCAYSRISQSDTGLDTYSCGNNQLLNTILRGQLGFTGWVLTDFGAVHRLSDLLGGVDSAMPNGNNAGIRDEPDPGTLADPPANTNVFAAGAGFPGGLPGSGKTLTQAVLNGTNAIPVNGNYPPIPATSGAQWAAALDNAVFHILTSMNRAGLLEGTPYGSRAGGCTAAAANCTPSVPARPDLQALQAPDLSVARDVADKSATLLKNTGGALPLQDADFTGGGVLVLGPTATATYVGGGGSAHVTPFEPIVNPLAALRAAAGSRHGQLRPGLRPRRPARAGVRRHGAGRPVRRPERLAAPADLAHAARLGRPARGLHRQLRARPGRPDGGRRRTSPPARPGAGRRTSRCPPRPPGPTAGS